MGATLFGMRRLYQFSPYSHNRSKISGDQKRFFIAFSLYPLSFFANTPFNEVNEVNEVNEISEVNEVNEDNKSCLGFVSF